MHVRRRRGLRLQAGCDHGRADDAGGVFDDTITEMCRELIDPERGQNLLVPTPNGFSDTGFNRDKYMPNPGKHSPADLKHYWFIGTLFNYDSV